PAIHAALLTPQGKILFDFFVVRADGSFLLETAADKAADLAKRLTMYKLRARATIQDRSTDYRVLAVWGTGPLAVGEVGAATCFPDPRLGALGLRGLAEVGLAPGITS